MRPQRLLPLLLLLGPIAAAAPQAGAPAVVVAGQDVPVPKRTKFVEPEYPPEARSLGQRGIVILEIVIDEQGKVASAEVVRSVPPFDEAALAAVRRWEYEVTKVGGKPVQVRHTFPITFTVKLPEVKRQQGIPELRQGVAPAFPPGTPQGIETVTADVTLESDGSVAQAQVRSGEPPWTELVLQALRTWRFVPASEVGVLSFRLQADFVPGKRGEPPKVLLLLSSPRHSESFAEAAPPSAAGAAEATTASAAASPAPSAASDEPGPPGAATAVPGAPAAVPATAVPATEAAVADPASPAAATAAPAAAPNPPDDAPAQPPTPAATPPSPGPAAAAEPAPAVEVMPGPAAAPRTPVSNEPGASAVRDVSLGAGVPDLVKGRRPVPPPLARMAGTVGSVEVRFTVDGSGASSVQSSAGPEYLKAAAADTVGSWMFRRTSTERLFLTAVIDYRPETATAAVARQP